MEKMKRGGFRGSGGLRSGGFRSGGFRSSRPLGHRSHYSSRRMLHRGPGWHYRRHYNYGPGCYYGSCGTNDACGCIICSGIALIFVGLIVVSLIFSFVFVEIPSATPVQTIDQQGQNTVLTNEWYFDDYQLGKGSKIVINKIENLEKSGALELFILKKSDYNDWVDGYSETGIFHEIITDSLVNRVIEVPSTDRYYIVVWNNPDYGLNLITVSYDYQIQVHSTTTQVNYVNAVIIAILVIFIIGAIVYAYRNRSEQKSYAVRSQTTTDTYDSSSISGTSTSGTTSFQPVYGPKDDFYTSSYTPSSTTFGSKGFCQNCGFSVEPTDKFCPNCGQRI